MNLAALWDPLLNQNELLGAVASAAIQKVESYPVCVQFPETRVEKPKAHHQIS